MVIKPECKKCGLCTRTEDPFLYKREPSWVGGERLYSLYTILVVGPGPREDHKTFFEGAAGEAVKEIVDGMENVQVVYHEALSCPSYKAKPKHLKLCRKATFEDVIAHYRPIVVITLGGNALYWATGQENLKINQVRHKVIKEEKFWLIPLPHLSNDVHFATASRRRDAEDLTEEYLHAFYTAEKICKYKGYHKVLNAARIVRTKAEAWEAIKNTQHLPIAAMDVETGQSMDGLTGMAANVNLKALTHWHPKAKLVSTSWTFPRPVTRGMNFGEYEYLTYVLVGEANCPEINREFFYPQRWKKLPNKRKVIAFNQKFDNQVHWKFLGLEPWELAECIDPFYLISLRDASKVGYGLKPLAKFYFGADDWDEGIKETLRTIQKKFDEESLANGTPKRYADYRHIPIKKLAQYNAWDTYYTARLYLEVCCDPFYDKCSDYAARVTHRQAECLSKIERVGLPLDKKTFTKKSEENYEKLVESVSDFYKLKLVKKAMSATKLDPKKNEFEWLNSKNLQKELVRVTGASVPLTAKAKLPSLNKDVIIRLGGVKFDKETKEMIPRDTFSSPSEELWYKYHNIKRLEHLASNFFNSYGKYIIDGFIHPNFYICKTDKGTGKQAIAESGAKGGGTKTGRLSTGAPQSQNLGGNLAIRDCFRAPILREGQVDWSKLQSWNVPLFKKLVGHNWLLAEADYNRIELVFLAHLSQDPKMMELMASGVDFHEATAREMFKIPSGTDVGKRERDIAKTLNFGLVYGQGVKAFAAGAGVRLDEAVKFFATFHKTFPGVRRLFKSNEKKIIEGEMIETLFGRRRSFRITGDAHYDAGQFREANNYIIQSPASDSTTEHLYSLYSRMEKTPKLQNLIIPINTVHDSIWFLLRQDHYLKCAAFIKKVMEDTSIFEFDFKLPISVEIKVGKKLSKMEKVKL